jgi:hypothetical protein
MGLWDGLAFGLIFLGYIALFFLHALSFLICNPDVSDDTFHATIGISSGLCLLIIVYSILVYLGRCGGWKQSGKRISAYIYTTLMLALAIANVVLISLSYVDRKDTTKDNENIYNWSFAGVTLGLVFLCFWYFGFQINDVIEK